MVKEKTSFEKEAKSFYRHLGDEKNSRIIFSGPFGVGKTHFFKRIAELNAQSTIEGTHKYNFFHLYPVNYSVGSNGDIIQLIKYDILFEFFKKEMEFKQYDITFETEIEEALKERLPLYLCNVFKKMPLIGKQLIEIWPGLIKYYKELKNKNSELKNLTDFINVIENQSTSIFESDIYTKIINSVLEREAEAGKTNVLIIDDLDRVDPDNIFRLLNIFSSHFDISGESANKFGFRKVVFVCDIKNIRKIFHHKFGVGVDFNGYIDKFYSTEIYNFENHYALNDWLNSNLKLRQPTNTVFSEIEKDFLQFILQFMIKIGKTNFRSIKKLDLTSVEQKLQLIFEDSKNYHFVQCRFVPIYILLIKIFGSYEELENKISDAENIFSDLKYDPANSLPIDRLKEFYEDVIGPIAFAKEHNWDTSSLKEKYYHSTQNLKFQLQKRDQFYVTIPSTGHFYQMQRDFLINFKTGMKILKENGIY